MMSISHSDLMPIRSERMGRNEHLFDEHDLARITKRSVASVRRGRLLKKGCPYIKIGSSVRYRPHICARSSGGWPP